MKLGWGWGEDDMNMGCRRDEDGVKVGGVGVGMR